VIGCSRVCVDEVMMCPMNAPLAGIDRRAGPGPSSPPAADMVLHCNGKLDEMREGSAAETARTVWAWALERARRGTGVHVAHRKRSIG